MNLRPLLATLSIQPKGYNIMPFRLNWAQELMVDEIERQLRETGRIRIITLKARQIGISTLTEGVLFTLVQSIDNYRGLVMGHKIKASHNLLNMTKLYWRTYPFRHLDTLRYASRNHMEWMTSNSSIQVATAGSEDEGRSSTLHFLHASEFAFWPNPDMTMLSLLQTIPNVPGTAIVIESTANGMGNAFQREWEAAEARETDYTPMFFPWHRHYEYRASYIGRPHGPIRILDDEERVLRSIGIDDDQLHWRRWAIKNLCQNDVKKFDQEYPTTPTHAFLATGTNVFPLPHLKAVYEPHPGIKGFLRRNGNDVEFTEAPNGPLTIYKYPSRYRSHGQYYVGGDPTRTTRGDYGCAQVLNRNTLEQVAIWRGRIDPATFGEEMFKLGLYYNTAYISCEKEGPGELAIGKLLGMEYPRVWRHTKIDRTPGKVTGDTYGWSTTAQTKHIAVGWLLKVIVDRNLTLHHDLTFNECKNFVTLENGSYGPASEDGFDDCVMALAIAVTCHFLDDPIVLDDDEVMERAQKVRIGVNGQEIEMGVPADPFEGIVDEPWYMRQEEN